MRVGLFLTCVNDTLYPRTGQATVALLERLGCDVDFPLAQTCCGQMHWNTGYGRQVEPLVRGFAETFAGYDAVVTPSGSCGAMIRDNHPRAAARSGDPGLADAVAQVMPKVYELTEFLVDVLQVTDVGAYFPHRVAYHPTCHSLRLMRLGDRPTTLLRNVRGLELVDLPGAEECCGFGGTFAVKNPDVSAAMGADKLRNAESTGADVLCAADNSCLMHLGGMISRRKGAIRTLHIAEILAATETDPEGAMWARTGAHR
ncbi:(Fe-S)-binding protein [Yinghuangia seranimata]|uniref:(Fe-S)-binding protein n=1 Tax=Yinghuangia seranimata TaxID=408067 RepID=UPI00248C9971|nr:(Fe-S)-binding protein [Yinghuangia seranimata]MDI2129395.1 (Fe-S)-binding protein [Yinghuangia seranimata]